MALVKPTRVPQAGGLFMIDGLPAIPEIGEIFPATRRWHTSKLKPCGTLAAWRRHQRRHTPFCDSCRAVRSAFDEDRPADTRR